jgi:hypothetical protein
MEASDGGASTAAFFVYCEPNTEVTAAARLMASCRVFL